MILHKVQSPFMKIVRERSCSEKNLISPPKIFNSIVPYPFYPPQSNSHLKDDHQFTRISLRGNETDPI